MGEYAPSADRQALLAIQQVVDEWARDSLPHRHEADYRQEIAMILMGVLKPAGDADATE